MLLIMKTAEKKIDLVKLRLLNLPYAADRQDVKQLLRSLHLVRCCKLVGIPFDDEFDHHLGYAVLTFHLPKQKTVADVCKLIDGNTIRGRVVYAKPYRTPNTD